MCFIVTGTTVFGWTLAWRRASAHNVRLSGTNRSRMKASNSTSSALKCGMSAPERYHISSSRDIVHVKSPHKKQQYKNLLRERKGQALTADVKIPVLETAFIMGKTYSVSSRAFLVTLFKYPATSAVVASFSFIFGPLIRRFFNYACSHDASP